MMKPSRKVEGISCQDGHIVPTTRHLAEETAIAISYNGTSHAVVMASPCELEELARGFSITEGIITSNEEIEDIRFANNNQGIDVQIILAGDASHKLEKRRRSMAGPVGCGMCGLESIEAAMRHLEPLTGDVDISPEDVSKAVSTMSAKQELNKATHSVHAAGFFHPQHGLIALCEDVGRHNALDKLIGKMSKQKIPMSQGAVAVTSRISVELVQKTVVCGATVLVAVSAPTGLAVDFAERLNLTLAAIVRGKEFEVFTHPHRIIPGAVSNVA